MERTLDTQVGNYLLLIEPYAVFYVPIKKKQNNANIQAFIF